MANTDTTEATYNTSDLYSVMRNRVNAEIQYQS